TISRDGMQACTAIEIEVLTGIEHIEARDPEGDRCGKPENAGVERTANGDPCSRGSNSYSKTEDDVRPACPSLGVGVEEKNGQGDGRKQKGEPIQLPCGQHKNSA